MRVFIVLPSIVTAAPGTVTVHHHALICLHEARVGKGIFRKDQINCIENSGGADPAATGQVRLLTPPLRDGAPRLVSGKL
jgi:hypothetical protein